MYMLDTNVCIDFLRGKNPNIYALMKRSDPSIFKIPAIVEAELRLGTHKSANPEKNRFLVEQFVAQFEVIPFDSKCAGHYAALRAELETNGNVIGPNDMLIAATALGNGATLVTNNVREFNRVPNLQLESWEEIDF